MSKKLDLFFVEIKYINNKKLVYFNEILIIALPKKISTMKLNKKLTPLH
jgi:hypothetical protein